MSCPYKTPGCDAYPCTKCRAARFFAHETAHGTVVWSGANKWGLYTGAGILIRNLSRKEARALIDEELLFRSLPRGEDR